MVSSIVLMTVLTAGAPPVLTTAPAQFRTFGRQGRLFGRGNRGGCGTPAPCGTPVYHTAGCGTACGPIVVASPVSPVQPACVGGTCTVPVTHAQPVVTPAHPVVISGASCVGGSCGVPVYAAPVRTVAPAPVYYFSGGSYCPTCR
jgi:hypothetical protein